MAQPIVVISTCGSAEEAEALARWIVESHLAACVSILAPVRSIYRFQGKVEDCAEWMLLIKTVQERFEEICSTIKANHSYSVPEVIALPVVNGAASYLEWLAAESHG